MSFYGLIAHFFLVSSNITLSGWSVVYLSVPPVKDIFVASLSCFLFFAHCHWDQKAASPSKFCSSSGQFCFFSCKIPFLLDCPH